MRDSTSEECLRYINALGDGEECKETLEFHAAVLLAQLGALQQLHTYHVSWPWRAILLLDASSWSQTLASMKMTWKFITEVIDTVPSQHPLFSETAITRHQAFRDLFIKGECLGYLMIGA